MGGSSRLIPPRYVNVPVGPVYDGDLPDGPARTFSQLCGLAWESSDDDKVTPPLTIEELAAICHRKKSTMWSHLGTLRDRSYISWQTVAGRLIIRILQPTPVPVQNFGLVQNSGLPSHAAADVVVGSSETDKQQQQQQQQLVQNSGPVQNSGLVQKFGPVQNSGLVQKFGPVQNSGLTANLEALAEYGVDAEAQPALEVAGLEHVVPDLIHAWGQHLEARPGVRNVPGLLLHILRTTQHPPREERRGGPRPRKRVEIRLPGNLLSDLALLGLVSTQALQEVAAAFKTDPDLVRGWIDYTRRQPNLANPAGFLLARLRSGDPPPAAAQQDPRRRYIEGEYAEFIEH